MLFILNASDYGVLQNRKRIILIGFHGEKADFYPQIPVVKDAHKVGELFCDLPSIKAGEGVITPVKTTHYTGKYLFSAGIKEYDEESVTFHQARPNVTDAQIIANLLSNPVKALIESGFFFYNEDSHVFSVSPDIWSTIDRSNKAAIMRICRQKLKDYYKD